MTRNVPAEGDLLAQLRSPYARAAVETFLDVFSRPTLTWPELARLRDHTSLPVLVKGVQSADDARLAVEHGVDGIVVSNHGGDHVPVDMARVMVAISEPGSRVGREERPFRALQ